MLLWVGAGAVVVAGAVVLRWAARRTDTLGRVRPFPFASVTVLLALAAAALVPWVARERLESRLSAAASEIVGLPVEVRCQTFGQEFVDVGVELGYVRFRADGTPESWTLIKREGCRLLGDYVNSDKSDPTRAEVVAVHTLTHEAIHMRGVRDEAMTECLAMQHDSAMAGALGAPPDAARALAVTYWSAIYPDMPSGYRSEECGPDGELDSGSADAPWRL